MSNISNSGAGDEPVPVGYTHRGWWAANGTHSDPPAYAALNQHGSPSAPESDPWAGYTYNRPDDDDDDKDSTRHRQQPAHPLQSQGPPATGRTLGQRFHRLSSKAGTPLNKTANLVGAEGFWPSTGAKECNKAARILSSFTNPEGLNVPAPPKTNGPHHPTGLTRNSLVKIPRDVLYHCAGLAIFNVLRAGAFHGSLAGGSGVVVARRPDGTWTPPSCFVVSTVGGGFMFGLDLHDCVCVLRTQDQVRAFASPRLSLGGEASLAVGPVGTGGSVGAALGKGTKPVFSYMKSRGLWAGVQVDGTVIVSRADANALFYNERGITARRILYGNVEWPDAGRPLYDILKAIEVHSGFDLAALHGVDRPPPAVREDAAEVPTQQTETALETPGGNGYGETAEEEKERLASYGY